MRIEIKPTSTVYDTCDIIRSSTIYDACVTRSVPYRKMRVHCINCGGLLAADENDEYTTCKFCGARQNTFENE